jgi:hypothetical protein
VKLLIVHHHFRPGGVRRVIELATPHLVAHWPQPVRGVVLATGEVPDPAWLRAFRARLQGTSVKLIVQPAFGYASELALDGRTLRRRVMDGLMELLRETKLQLRGRQLPVDVYAARRRSPKTPHAESVKAAERS